MNRRTTESPMDFEWQTSGPADHTSPFHQLAVNYQQKQQNEKHGQKRTHGVFDSPVKSSAPVAPSSQSFLFSPPSPAKTFPAFRRLSFTTPRKFELDISSGPEASSPENADGEDTPDNRMAQMALVRKDDNDDDSPTKPASSRDGDGRSEKKAHLFDIPGKVNTPGRGEVRRGFHKMSDALTRRIKKKRRNADVDRETRHHHHHHRYETEDSDNNGYSGDIKRGGHSKFQQQQSSSSSSFIPSLFTYLESHPNLPHVLSYYAQFLLNVFLVFFFIYIIYSFWSTIRSDVDKKSEVVAAETLAEMAACAHQFVENRCDRATRVPAMESVCDSWERCMNKDPSSVGRARVSAHTFAEIFNSFVEPISYKAMIFSLIMVFGCVAISNFAFGFFRAKTQPFIHHPHHPVMSPPAATAPPPPPAGYLSSPSHHQFHPHEPTQQGYYPLSPSYIRYDHHSAFRPTDTTNAIENL